MTDYDGTTILYYRMHITDAVKLTAQMVYRFQAIASALSKPPITVCIGDPPPTYSLFGAATTARYAITRNSSRRAGPRADIRSRLGLRTAYSLKAETASCSQAQSTARAESPYCINIVDTCNWIR